MTPLRRPLRSNSRILRSHPRDCASTCQRKDLHCHRRLDFGEFPAEVLDQNVLKLVVGFKRLLTDEPEALVQSAKRSAARRKRRSFGADADKAADKTRADVVV